MKHLIRNILILLSAIAILAACKKDDIPPSIVGTPVFTSNFSFDGNPYELSAGVDGLTLETQTSIISDTIVFNTSLDSTICVSCGPAIYVDLVGQEYIFNWVNQDFAEKLLNWNYAFTEDLHADSVLKVLTSSQSLNGIWYLNDVAQNTQPIDSFEFQIEDFGNYEIKFESPELECGNPAFQNFEYNGTQPCFVNLSSSTLDTLFTAQPDGGFNPGNLTYIWNYNDTTITTFTPFLFMPNVGQSDEMCVTVMEQGGCTESVCMNISSNPTSCITNFRVDSMVVNYNSIFIPAAIMKLTFVDETGAMYSSSLNSLDQPSFTNIELLEATPYTEPNEPNRSFVKVKYEIDCMLYDALGNGKIFNGIVETAFEDPGL